MNNNFSGDGVKTVAPAPVHEKNDIQMLSESKTRELIKQRPFLEIARKYATADWDGKPLVEDRVYHLNKMAGLKVAIIRDNRRTHRRAIKMFNACMKCGMTTPAILVSASIVYGWGLSLIDPTSGKELKEDELKDVYCVMEGHARLDGWVISLISAPMNNEKPFDFKFVYNDYPTPEAFGKAYTSCNVDMTRTTSKDRLAIASARCKDPIVISYLEKIRYDHVIPKAAFYWTVARELRADEITKLTYGEGDAPMFDKILTDALTLCYESFKSRFSAEGAEIIYRGVPAAQWCADQLLNHADQMTDMALVISEKVKNMDYRIYTPIVTAKTSKKAHITRDQKIKANLDQMMNS